MTIDPQTLTYVMIGLLGAIAMLVVVILFAVIFRRAPSVGPGSLTAIRGYLRGRKTYILAGAVMALGLAKQQGYIDLPTYDRYVEFLTGGALITFKAALARVEARLAAASAFTVTAGPSGSATIPGLTPRVVVPPPSDPPAVLNPIPPSWPPSGPEPR